MCEEGMIVEWMITMDNTNSLMKSMEQMSFKVEIYQEDDHLIEQINEEYYALPALSGAGLDNMRFERLENKLGALDTIKFYVPRLSATFNQDTDVTV